MNIFIYGKDDFKKDIRKILNDSKIDDKLDDIEIIELTNLSDLKEQIASNPDDVFLIDDAKISKKSKFGFIKAKDAIEEDFLLQCGVSELSIDSFAEIPEYIVKKHKRLNSLKEQSDMEIIEEDLEKLAVEKDASEIINKEEDKITIEDSFAALNSSNHSEDFNEDFGLNNVDLDYDDSSIVEEIKDEKTTLNSESLNLSEFVSDDFDMQNFSFDEDTLSMDSIDELFMDEDNFENTIDKKDTEDLEKEPQEKIDVEEKKELDLEDEPDEYEEFLKGKEEILLNTNDDLEDIKFLDDSKIEDDIESSFEESLLAEDLDSFDFSFDEKSEKYKDEKEEIYLGDIEKSIEKSLEDINEVSQKYDFDEIEDEIVKDLEEEIIEKMSIQKEENMSEILDLEDINEEDMLDALGLHTDSVRESSFDKFQNNESSERNIKRDESTNNTEANIIDLNASNIDDVTALLSNLLKNKSVELSIKIKE